MAKYLKDILKQAHDTIKGVRSSETGQLSIGKDPGVDYKPKAGDEADFVAKHSVQKWDDPAGNPNFADKAKEAPYKKQSKATNEEVSDSAKKILGDTAKKHGGKVPFTSTTYKDGKKSVTKGYNDEKGNRVVTSTTNEEVSESKKAEDVQCNSTPKVTECPIHGVAECMSAGPLKELSNKTLGGYVQGATRDALSKQYSLGKGEKVDTNKLMNRRKGIDKAVDKMAKEEVEQIDELSTDLLHRAAHKAAKVAMTDVQGRSGPIFKKRAAQANKFRAKGMEQEKKEKAVKEETINEGIQTTGRKDLHGKDSKLHHKELKASGYVSKGNNANYKNPEGTEHSYYHAKSNTMHVFRAKGGKINHAFEWNPNHSYAKAHGGNVKEEALDEVLTKSTTAGETISDFVHSDNPKFKGKSKEKRKQMALAAYYQKQRNEEVEILEDAHEIAKKYKDYVTGGGTPETASRYKSHVNMLSKKTGEHPDAINKQVRKHVKAMNEAYAVEPLLGGDQPPRGESDEAIEMVKAELKALANKAMHLVMQMPQGMHVEPWCQAKIAQAKSYVSDVHDYMVYGDHEENEQTDTPITLPNMSVDVNTGQNV